MLFVGTHEHTIDAKQRLAIPSEIRRGLELAGEKALYCVLVEGPTLALYTESAFHKRAEELDRSELSPEEVLRYEQMFFSNAARVELDPQGRVRLPERLLGLAGLGGKTVLIGVKDHLQLHDSERWGRQSSEMMKQPGMLMNPRLKMKSGGR